MVAGPVVLEQYTSNRVDDDNDVHPAGIFAKVLGMHIVGPGVEPNTYPEKVSHLHNSCSFTLIHSKIILTMWHECESLTEEIKSVQTKPPLEWDSESYQKLIESSFTWWTLLRMFKKGRLPGLNIKLKREFQCQEVGNGSITEHANPLPLPPLDTSRSTAASPPLVHDDIEDLTRVSETTGL